MLARPVLILPSLFAVAICAISGHRLLAQTDKDAALKRCLAIANEAQRLECLKMLMTREQQAAPTIPPAPAGLPSVESAASTRELSGNWRLVRTPHPRGGKDAVSVMRTSELSQSDINLAGLMIRCSEVDIETLVILVRPLPPRAQPNVLIDAVKYPGTVISPGAAILLPATVTSLVETQWLTREKLTIDVDEDGSHTKGVVSLKGLDNAVVTLKAACSVRATKPPQE